MYDVVILTDHRYVNPKKTDWYTDQVLLEDQLLQTALENKGLKVIKKTIIDIQNVRQKLQLKGL